MNIGQTMSNKTLAYTIRLHQDEAEAFDIYAKKKNSTRSKLLRQFIREAINEEPDLLPNEQIMFRQAVGELVRCTRNLNQALAAIRAGELKADEFDKQAIQTTLNAVNGLKFSLNLYLKHTHLRYVKILDEDN